MSDMVLDLSSKPAMVAPKLEQVDGQHEFGGSSDSGRASIGSENSDPDAREENLSSGEEASHSGRREKADSPRTSFASPDHYSSGEEDRKCEQSADRVNPVRPFKMYPMDPFSVYSNPLMASAAAVSTAGFSPGMAGAALSGVPGVPGHPGVPGMGGLANPLDSSLSLTLTPLTSHFLQRKRRQDSRETESSAKKAKSVPVDLKDDCYWERRRKNNDAAKRSRDSRRMKEEEIAMRAAFLEQENLKLRAQVAILKNETTKLHYMLYNRV